MANKKPLNVELLNMLVKPLIEMSLETPYFAAVCARTRIQKIREQFVGSIKNSGQIELKFTCCILCLNYFQVL